MRTLIILSFFICIYLHFQTKEGSVQQLDSLNTKQASIKKIVPHKARLASKVQFQPASSLDIADIEAASGEELIAEVEAQDFDEDDLSQLPWDDIEEGWKTHLKEYLVSLDPEKADEMFAAYMDEKKKYVERVDFTDQENGQDEGKASSDLLTEQDGKEDELERMHSENLKEIFGDHYSQVQSLHQEYVDSVQYLNRSSVKFSISL